MIKNTLLSHAILLLTCTVLMISCLPLRPVAEEPRTDIPGPSTASPVTATAKVSPTMSAATTVTAIPSPTPTSEPWTTQPITVDTLDSLKVVNHWGRGTVIKLEKLANKQAEYLVLTPIGLYWYSSPALLNFVPDADDFIVSSDGNFVAASLKNGDVKIWTLDSMSIKQTITHVFPVDLIQQIENHELLPYYVGGMAFSVDGAQIAIGYADGKVEIWRVGEPNPYATVQHDALTLWRTDIGLLYDLSFSPDGKTLAVFKFARYTNINANRVTFWSLPDAQLISVSDAARYYRFPRNAYLPDGNTLLIYSSKDSYLYLELWDAAAGKFLNKFGTGLVEIDSLDIAVAGDEVTIVGPDAQGVYYRQVRKLTDGKMILNEKLDQLPEDAEMARFQDFLLEQGHYSTSWGDDQNPELATITGVEGLPMQIKLEKHLLRIPDADLQSLLQPENVARAYYDPQGNFVAWCEPGILNIRDRDGKTTVVELFLNSTCNGVAISSRRSYAAIWYGASLYMLNLNTGTYGKASFEPRWVGEEMLSARFSLDEQLLISSKNAIVTVWQVEPFQRLGDSHKAESYMGRNVDIAISKNKTLAVSLSLGDGTTADRLSHLMVWRLPDAFLLHRINLPLTGYFQPMFTSLDISPDTSLVATGDDFGGIRFWSTQTGEELHQYEVDSRPLDLEFTPDGSGLIIVLTDGTILLLGTE